MGLAGQLLLLTLCSALLFHACGAEKPSKTQWIEQLSWKPRAYLYHNLLSDEEADHIIELAKPAISRSSVVSEKGGVSKDDIRTSYGTFLSPSQDETVSRIEERVSKWVQLPVSHFESMQVLKYVDGQKYGAHWDEINPAENPKGLANSSLRIVTVLMYLSDVEYGGETAFPHSRWLDAARQNRTEFSECARDGVAALARKGDAIMFFGMKPSYVDMDLHSMHTGCPVLAGEKWSATFWIHGDRFRAGGLQLSGARRADSRPTIGAEGDAAACRDVATDCAPRRTAGLCASDRDTVARCAKTCARCCLPGDVLCERKLRGAALRAAAQDA